MTKEVLVDIHGFKYQGIVSEDGTMISVLNVVDLDDVDFLGRFILDGIKLVECYPMSDRKVVIGEIVKFI